MTSATVNQPFVFTPGTVPSGTGSDPLVDQTRREISEIVRDVAAAVRSDRSEDEFLSLLVDRILRAMAAEGVIVWRRTAGSVSNEPAGFEAIRRIGRLTDASIPIESIGPHSRLLIEVVQEGQPVVVPATPGASDPDVPANPMQVPAALVPIETGTSPNADYLLEIFLESECGVATQRGYLRFVAQMADLAGEFLRGDQLRRLQRGHEIANRVDEAIASLHEASDREQIETAVVDQAAELFGFDRVGLCYLSAPKTSLVAVSHVSTIDSKSPAAEQLRQAASVELDDDGCRWIAVDREETEHRGEQHDNELVVRAVAGFGEADPIRLVCLQSIEATVAPDECRQELIRFVRHAEIALRQVSRWEAIPGGRLLVSLAPKFQSRGNANWTRPISKLLLLGLLVIAAFFPLPLVVHSSATLRPAEVQTVSAPRDATVQRIHVVHGQTVERGDELLTLVDPALEQQITALVGRRAVLVQQQARWTEALVDPASRRHDQSEQIQSERSLVAGEIRSIDEQLELLYRVAQSLVIRADRDGIVDAWQIHERLDRRPLERGDLLLKVIAQGSPWLIDTGVRQSRISHVQLATNEDRLRATVSLVANPDQCWPASIVQIGPATKTKSHREIDETAVILRLDDNANELISQQRQSGSQSGAPADVMFHCGKAPAAYLLFQDLIRSTRGALSLYFSSPQSSSQSSAQSELPSRPGENL